MQGWASVYLVFGLCRIGREEMLIAKVFYQLIFFFTKQNAISAEESKRREEEKNTRKNFHTFQEHTHKHKKCKVGNFDDNK